MNNTCPTPGCGASYKVTAAHVGNRFACRKCGAELLIGAGGLELAGGAAPGGGGDFAMDAGNVAPGRRGSAALQGVWGRFLTDSASWLFAIGVVLVVVFLFFPVIDQTKVGSYQARIEAGELYQGRLDRDLQNRKKKDTGKDWSAEDKSRREAREKWDEQKKDMEDDVQDARTSAKRSVYWYTWFMLWGFVFLALGALGFLKPEQMTTRRVVGAIVLCAIVVLIFMVYLFTSAASSLTSRF